MTNKVKRIQEQILSVLPTVGFVNIPGDPNDGAGDTVVGNGAVILTETKMILFCSRASRSGSASDSIEGTTRCCCCTGCCGVCVCEAEKKRKGEPERAHIQPCNEVSLYISN